MKVAVVLFLAVGACVSTASVVSPRDGSCLSPQQQDQLEASVTAIQNILGVSSKTLRSFAENEKNPQVQDTLKTAARVIDVVNAYVCGNLTKIAEEACGSCGSVVKAVRDAVQTIEDTITTIEPEWKDQMIFKEVVIALDAVVSAAADICPSSIVPVFAQDDNCLTPQQKRDLETSVKVMKTVLGSAIAALDVAISAEKDENIKDKLMEARKVILAICKDIVENLVHIGEEACGTCNGIVKTISDSVDDIEKAIGDIEPAWTQSPIFKDIITGIDSVLEIATNSCPSYPFFHVRSQGSCLSDDQEQKLEEVVKQLDKFFQVVVVSLEVAAAAVPDEDTKKKLQEAAKIINAVEKDIIRKKLVNITREASCGKCQDIIKTITDAVSAVEDTITKVVPEWGDNELYQAIVQAIGEILSLADQFCDDGSTFVLKLTEDKDCLNPDQEETLKTVIKRLDEGFKAAAGALDIAAAAATDPEKKKKLKLAAKVVEATDQDVIQDKLAKLTQEGSCGSCDDIVKTVRDSVTALESVLTEVVPEWRSNPLFQTVDNFIKFVLSRADAACAKKGNPSLLRGQKIEVAA